MMTYKIFRLILLLLLPLSADAIGFREISVDSFLGEPLKARIQLVSVDTAELEDLKVALAEPEEFEKAGVSRPYILSKLRFRVAAGRVGDATIFITSRETIREPFLNFLIVIDWKGTRILREYTLLLDPPSYRPAIVAVPSRPAIAAAVPQKQKTTEPVMAGESYGPVKRSETLWVIAKKLRPDNSISIEQMMMAIQKENPDAFNRGNVNLLKRGAVLSLPDRQTIEQLTRVEAKRAFQGQYREWKAFRSGKQTASTRQAAPRKIEKQPTDELPPTAAPAVAADVIQPEQRELKQLPETVQQPVPAEKDKPQNEQEASLRVVEPGKEWPIVDSEASSEEGFPSKPEDKLQVEIADSQQELKAAREINRDLAELRTALEVRIDALRASLEEKNRIIERLEKRLDKMAASIDGIQGGSGNETTPGKQEKVTPGVTLSQAEIGSGVQKAPPAPARPAEQKSQPWGLEWVMHYWLPLLAAIVVLLMLLLALLLRRRHVESTVPGPDAFGSYIEMEEELKPERVPEHKMDQDIVKAYDDDAGLFVEAGGDVASALTEADIYLAYRRYSQAEALIKESIAANPDSMVLPAKLLEIYAFRKDKKRFVSFMEEIYQAIVAEAPEIWAKVVEMGRDLAPEHPLISGALLPEEKQGDVDLPDVIPFTINEDDSGKKAFSSEQVDGISVLNIEFNEDDEEDESDKR